MSANLLLTKLSPPTIPAQVVQRPLLQQKLHDGLVSGRKLTLVSAPAGFGKTTFMRQWTDGLQLPVTWLRLDAGDDDPIRFFIYLIAALQKIDASLGQELDGLLRAGQLPPNEIISTTLINDLLALERPFVLVLDDVHLIQDETILQLWKTLLANLPQQMHLVLLTREEPALPLARMRANNLLTELRAADLRFSLEETAVFLNDVMGLKLNPAEMRALESKTEGWVVGLQLAALSMRDRPHPAQFIAELSGSHRHILSYLTEEVLNQQPPELQSFLLQTSILDQLNGDLCDAVTGGTNGRLLLEQLYQDNLFLMPLDDDRQWYRYHQLFADLLQDQQAMRGEVETAVLHRRASGWFVQAGLVIEGIHHALDAADDETAVSLIETHAMELLLGWHAKTIKQWMQRLPEEWVAKSAKTNLMFAWMYLMSNDFAQALPYIDRLQKLFAASDSGEIDPSAQAEWLALQANLLVVQGNPAESIAVARQALAIVPEQDDYVRSLIYSGLASAYIQLNEREQAIAAYEKLIEYGRMAGSLLSELMGITGLGLFAIERGSLQFAYELALQGAESIDRSGMLPPISSAVYGELGAVCLQWMQMDKADAYLARSAQVSKLSGFSDAEIYYHVVVSRLALMNGDVETAVTALEQAEKVQKVEAPTAVPEELLAQQIRLALAQHDLSKAESILNPRQFSFGNELNMPAFSAEKPLNRRVSLLYISALRLILYQKNRVQWQEGVQWASRLLAEARNSQLVPIEIETLLIRAQLWMALGNHPHSQADVQTAVALSAPENAMLPFVEEGAAIAQILTQLTDLDESLTAFRDQVLAAFPPHLQSQQKPDPNAQLVEPLSQREREILQLIEDGCTNQDIAERLVITLHTVKKHSSNIYAKLGVRSRTQAIAKARELNLLT